MTMECRVEFDYEAQESDELNLTKGDIITNVVTKMDGWWEGTLSTTGQRGMFPDNFVKVVTSHSNSSADESQGTEKVQMRQKAGPSARRLKAMFSYTPEQEDELSLEVGDVVDFIAEVEEGWWRGQLKGRTGIFPSNFVAEFEPATSTSSTAINGKLVTPETSKNELTKHNEKHRISSNSKIPPDVIPAEKPTEIKVEDEPAPKLPPKPDRTSFTPIVPVNNIPSFLLEVTHDVGSSDDNDSIYSNYKTGKNLREFHSLSTPPTSDSQSPDSDKNCSIDQGRYSGSSSCSSPVPLPRTEMTFSSPYYFFTSTPTKPIDEPIYIRKTHCMTKAELQELTLQMKEALKEKFINTEYNRSELKGLYHHACRSKFWNGRFSNLQTIQETDESGGE